MAAGGGGDRAGGATLRLIDLAAEICSVFPYTLEQFFDLDYDQIGRLYETVNRLQYEAQRRMTFAVAQAIGLAVDKKAEIPLPWEELQERAKRREKFRQSIYVVKGRRGNASTKAGTRNPG